MFRRVSSRISSLSVPSRQFSLPRDRQHIDFFGAPLEKVAIILSGAGVHDGNTPMEVSSLHIHLSSMGYHVDFYAPDKEMNLVSNHLTMRVDRDAPRRNVLKESARLIGNREMDSLKNLDPRLYRGILFPGGYGNVKNLVSFKRDKLEPYIDPEINRVVNLAYDTMVPIGCMGFGVFVPVAVLNKKVRDNERPFILTLGMRDDPQNWPHCALVPLLLLHYTDYRDCDLDSAVVDGANLLCSSPGGLKQFARPHEIYNSCGVFVDSFVRLMLEGTMVRERAVTDSLEIDDIKAQSTQAALLVRVVDKDHTRH